ncbi:MAG: DUF3365 domain-containing protein [Azonexus sp.]|nr:DUF3365 domain-containing protein [Azonexus sp.]MBP6906971.1 DUF3365 domain-containing protein [Azonexus sp.]
MTRIPQWIARRVWWLGLLALWAGAVGLSLQAHLADTREHSLDLALESARNMFRMVVLVRSWNAAHGGVYVPVTGETRPNPYLEHPRRDVTTGDGQSLTLVNPAFMTRQLGELAEKQGGVVFHITNRKPIRPANRPDPWEDAALLRFEAGVPETWEVVGAPGEPRLLRYMAPLRVTPACLRCHEKQGYREGDIRGGISVTQPYAKIEAAADQIARQDWLTHGLIFLLVAAAGFGLLEVLRRRWLHLDHSIDLLEAARGDLLDANRSLAVARDGAEAASRAKTSFLANMGHELRTPMNAITGFAYLLKRELADGRQQAMVEHITGAAGNLLGLLDRILELAALEAGSVVPEHAPFSPRQLVETEAARVRSDLIAAGRADACTVEVGEGVPVRAVGDSGRLGEILRHFCSNAVKFSSRGDVGLRLEVERGEGGAVLLFAVMDRGIGIAAEDLAGLFQPFHQVEGQSTRRFGGTGVGLGLCRRLAHLLGGEVGVESTPGEGSRFWLRVPLVEERAAAERGVAEASDAYLSGLDALLAEDDPGAVRYWRTHEAALRRSLGSSADAVAEAVLACDFALAGARLQVFREGTQSGEAGSTP